MGKKKTPAAQSAPAAVAQIYEAVLGAVKKGKLISQAQAETRRKGGHDVVVCGMI